MESLLKVDFVPWLIYIAYHMRTAVYPHSLKTFSCDDDVVFCQMILFVAPKNVRGDQFVSN